MNQPQHVRIAGLDGLRALSVIAVFLAHTGLAGVAGGGYVGVDVFFVLSGYLITNLLVAEHLRTGRIDLPAFYWRRARRLYPALLLMLAGVSVYCLIFPAPLRLGLEVLPAFFYVMNWVRAFEIYDAHLTGHTWTLAIEEQFYLVWPLILLGVLKFWPRRILIAVALLTGRGDWVAFVSDVARLPGGPRLLWFRFPLGRSSDRRVAGSGASPLDLLGRQVVAGCCCLSLFRAAERDRRRVFVAGVGLSADTVAEHSFAKVVARWFGCMLVGLGRVSYGFYLHYYR
jgi:peptidoglycan/LPS O-acetylase OafA/YrhL